MTVAQGGTTHSDQSIRPLNHRGRVVGLLATGLVAVLIVAGLNYFLIGQPIASKLDADQRNGGFTLNGHYAYYVVPSTLVLNLRRAESVSPLDLFRGLFEAAAAMHDVGRHFDHVLLVRSGTMVFQMKGDDFATLGGQYVEAENPVYLIRTLPEKLYRPDGVAAFGTWTGGLLGVLGKQMEDATSAGRQWAAGTEK